MEGIPFIGRNNERTTYAFLDMVLSRFGVLTKVLINRGTKFRKEFQELCEKTLIDHCSTS